jgi:hypothetical protein
MAKRKSTAPIRTISIGALFAKAAAILNSEKPLEDIDDQTKQDNAMILSAYEKILSSRIRASINKHIDNIGAIKFDQETIFSVVSTDKDGNEVTESVTVTCSEEPTYNTSLKKGYTNEQLKNDYALPDSIILSSTKKIVSLNKSALYDALNSGDAAVTKAYDDGAITKCDKTFVKDITSSTVTKTTKNN